MTDVAQAVARAAHLIEVRRFAEARAELTRVLAVEPESAAVLEELAYVELYDGKPAEAVAAAKRAAAVAPEHERCHRLLSAAYGRTHDVGRSLDAAREAVRLAPNLAETHLALSSAYMRSHLFRQAEDAVDRALALTPTYREARRQKAMLLHQRKDLVGAEQLLRDLLAEDPGDAQTVHYLGLVVDRRGRKDEARDLFVRASALDPHYQASRASLRESVGKWGLGFAVAVYILLRVVATSTAGIAAVIGVVVIIVAALVARRVVARRRLSGFDPTVTDYVMRDLFSVRGPRHWLPALRSWWAGRRPVRVVVAQVFNHLVSGIRTGENLWQKAVAVVTFAIQLVVLLVVLCAALLVVGVVVYAVIVGVGRLVS